MRPFVAHLRADAALAEFDEQLGLAFDGRLDNRRELSAMLGEQFASDASLALACWRRFGKAAPERWQGPFAVAVLERASGRAWLARDEVGVRGLAYGRDLDGNWVAATFEHEVARAIAAGLDEVRIAAFLALREPEPWRSFFVGVSQALPGELTELRADGTVVRTPLARPHQAPAPVEGDLEIAAVEFTQHVDSAVRHTLDDCDPPFALLFSGGLDSTTLACSMVAQGRPPAALISTSVRTSRRWHSSSDCRSTHSSSTTPSPSANPATGQSIRRLLSKRRFVCSTRRLVERPPSWA
jgi:asparagine synthase (glutamine-hydrolysing)